MSGSVRKIDFRSYFGLGNERSSGVGHVKSDRNELQLFDHNTRVRKIFECTRAHINNILHNNEVE